MALVITSQSNLALKFFSSKLYKIRARPLDYLGQIWRPVTTPRLGSNPGAHFRRDFPLLSVKKRDRKYWELFYRVTFAIVIIDISNFLQYVICGYVCFSWDKHYITVTRVKCFPSWIEVSSTKEHWLSS